MGKKKSVHLINSNMVKKMRMYYRKLKCFQPLFWKINSGISMWEKQSRGRRAL